jgi:hypothetical protein
MAVLAAARLLWEGASLRPFGVRTYGQPAVGWGEFAESYEPKLGALTCRYVNHGDPIPRLPPAAVHSGAVRRFLKGGGYAVSGLAEGDVPEVGFEGEPMMDEGEEQRFFDSLKALPEGEDLVVSGEGAYGTMGAFGSALGAIPWVRQHSIDTYIGNLRSRLG